MGHQIRVVRIFWRCDIGCESSDGSKKDKERKTDDCRRIFENPMEGVSELSDSGMVFKHNRLIQ